MIFTLDKHNQLIITAAGDFSTAPGEPDTIVLTQDETDEVRELLCPGQSVDIGRATPERPSTGFWPRFARASKFLLKD